MRAMKRGLLLLVVTVGLTGCRLVGAPPTEMASPTALASPSGVASPSVSAVDEVLEAPEDCQFPAGAALEFAGRSTYAELRVGDAKGASGDPMSDEPADIYITRDPITQEGSGPLGRFVCAIFVGEYQGFVEITMHPDDWDRYSPVPRPGEPANGLSADEAIEAASAGLPGGDEWRVHVHGAGPIEEFLATDYRDDDWVRELPAHQWVWTFSAERGTQAMLMFIDYVAGTVVGTIEFTLDECGRYPSDSEYGTEPCPDL
jgi:hypothetical protein